MSYTSNTEPTSPFGNEVAWWWDSVNNRPEPLSVNANWAAHVYIVDEKGNAVGLGAGWGWLTEERTAEAIMDAINRTIVRPRTRPLFKKLTAWQTFAFNWVTNIKKATIYVRTWTALLEGIMTDWSGDTATYWDETLLGWEFFDIEWKCPYAFSVTAWTSSEVIIKWETLGIFTSVWQL